MWKLNYFFNSRKSNLLHIFHYLLSFLNERIHVFVGLRNIRWYLRRHLRKGIIWFVKKNVFLFLLKDVYLSIDLRLERQMLEKFRQRKTTVNGLIFYSWGSIFVYFVNDWDQIADTFEVIFLSLSKLDLKLLYFFVLSFILLVFLSFSWSLKGFIVLFSDLSFEKFYSFASFCEFNRLSWFIIAGYEESDLTKLEVRLQ